MNTQNDNKNNGTSRGGVSFCGMLFIVFLVLKLPHVIEWSWWGGVKYLICDDEDKMRARGFTSVPMLEVDGDIMDFKTAVDWINGEMNE